jgi:hypothetical protein
LKCKFCQLQTNFLGHVIGPEAISPEAISPHPQRIAAILSYLRVDRISGGEKNK